MALLSTHEFAVDHLKNLALSMNIMRKVEDSTDILLQVQDYEFPVHRLVLSAASSYFHAMFHNSNKEAMADRIQLHGLNPTAVSVALHYIYTGELNMEDDIENIKSILYVTHLWQLDFVCNHCFHLLSQKEKLKQCFADLWNLAEQYDNTATIARFIVGYAQDNFSKVVLTSQFLLLTKNQLKSLLCTPCINDSTDKIVQAVLSWVDYKPKERQDYLLELLEILHLYCLSSEYLSKLVEHERIRNNVDILNLLLKASTKQLQIMDSKENSLLVVHFGEDENGENLVSVYLNDTRKWSKKLVPFTISVSTAVSYYKEHFYFIGGGNTSAESTNSVVRYCLDTNTVQEVASLGSRKLNIGTAVLRDNLYAVGGLSPSGPVGDVEYYNGLLNKWQPAASTNRKHNFPRVVQALDHILVVGSKTSSDVELYNPEFDQWSELSPLPILSKLYWPRVTVFQGKVYSLYEHSDLYVYSTFKNAWEPIKLPGHLPLCCIWNDAGQSLPFLVVTNSSNNLYKFDPFLKQFDKICEAHESIQWNWWQTLVVTVKHDTA